MKKEHAALENHDDELSSRRSVLLASLLHLVLSGTIFINSDLPPSPISEEGNELVRKN